MGHPHFALIIDTEKEPKAQQSRTSSIPLVSRNSAVRGPKENAEKCPKLIQEAASAPHQAHDWPRRASTYVPC